MQPIDPAKMQKQLFAHNPMTVDDGGSESEVPRMMT